MLYLIGVNGVAVYRGWCKKCGICIAFCPKKVLEADEASYPVVKEPEKCTGCRLCEIRCPDLAIVVDKKDEKNNGEAGSSSGQ